MRRRHWSTLLLLILAGHSAHAHLVPVPPSTCAFDPVEIAAPADGITATAAAATTSDVLRIVYDPQASQAQFDLRTVPARDFTVAGSTGTLALPALFVSTLSNAGDLATTVPLAFTVDGAPATVPMTLTTGLAVAGGTIVEGAPLAADGSFTLAGVTAASSLGGPFAGRVVSVRLTCKANPRPDTDQFAVATQTTFINGSVNARTLRVRVIFAPPATVAPDLPGAPAVLRLRLNGALVASVEVPSGLAARGKKLFVGDSADGRATVAVRSLKRGGKTVYLLGAKVTSPTLTPLSGKRVPAELVYTAGGLFSRATASFKVKGHGTRAAFP
jgi:hypothetical protein